MASFPPMSLPAEQLMQVSEYGAAQVLKLLSSFPQNLRDVFLSVPKDVAENSAKARGYLSEKVICCLADLPKSQWAQESKKCLEVMALLFPAETTNETKTETHACVSGLEKPQKLEEPSAFKPETDVKYTCSSLPYLTNTCANENSCCGNNSPRGTEICNAGDQSTMYQQDASPTAMFPFYSLSHVESKETINSASLDMHHLQMKCPDQMVSKHEQRFGLPLDTTDINLTSVPLRGPITEDPERDPSQMQKFATGTSEVSANPLGFPSLLDKLADICNADGQINTGNMTAEESSILIQFLFHQRRLLFEKLQEAEKLLEQILGGSSVVIDLKDLFLHSYQAQEKDRHVNLEECEKPIVIEAVSQETVADSPAAHPLEAVYKESKIKTTHNVFNTSALTPPVGLVNLDSKMSQSYESAKQDPRSVVSDLLVSARNIERSCLRRRSTSIVDCMPCQVIEDSNPVRLWRNLRRAKTIPAFSPNTEQIQKDVTALLSSSSLKDAEMEGYKMTFASNVFADSQYLGLKKSMVRFLEGGRRNGQSEEPEAEEDTTRNFLKCAQQSAVNTGVASENIMQSNEVHEVLHMQARCKPCAFFYNKKKGCRNGENCEFCHHEDHSRMTLKQWKKQQHRLLRAQVRSMTCSESVYSPSDVDSMTPTGSGGSPSSHIFDAQNNDIMAVAGNFYNVDGASQNSTPSASSVCLGVDPALVFYPQINFPLGLPYTNSGVAMSQGSSINSSATYPFYPCFPSPTAADEKSRMTESKSGDGNSLNFLGELRSPLTQNVYQSPPVPIAISNAAGLSSSTSVPTRSQDMAPPELMALAAKGVPRSALPPEQNGLDVVYGAIGKELQAHLAALLQD